MQEVDEEALQAWIRDGLKEEERLKELIVERMRTHGIWP